MIDFLKYMVVGFVFIGPVWWLMFGRSSKEADLPKKRYALVPHEDGGYELILSEGMVRSRADTIYTTVEDCEKAIANLARPTLYREETE